MRKKAAIPPENECVEPASGPVPQYVVRNSSSSRSKDAGFLILGREARRRLKMNCLRPNEGQLGQNHSPEVRRFLMQQCCKACL